VAELVDQINSENPEFVILGGDVTDELTTYDDMLATYMNLSALKAPTYFIYGNHDRQPDWDYFGSRTYTDEQLEETIKSSGITILSDEYVQLADDLVMLGREDVSMTDLRKDWKTLKNPYAGKGALIVADHQPYDNEQLAVEDSVLQLSGHTHAGQMWPLQKIYRLAGRQAYGEFKYPGTMLYVTAGESDWMMPLRTEEHCEWDLVTIRP
ncbi:MAG: metallophosphoesterase, partial [Mogibacterium sp.]|nr:metallophosphoesterase [Mogibacterium sp.]